VILFELNAKVIMQIFVRNSEYQDAYTIIGTMAFGFAQQVLITLLTAPLYSNRNSNFILLSYVIGGSVNIALNFLLIPRIGILGAALSTAISALLVASAMAYLNYRVAAFRFLEGRSIYLAVVFIFVWAAVLRLKEHVSTLTAIIVDVPLILTLGSMLYFYFINANERPYLRGLVKDLMPRGIRG
jgi:O-antigen/teichoic acid export membrane protein